MRTLLLLSLSLVIACGGRQQRRERVEPEPYYGCGIQSTAENPDPCGKPAGQISRSPEPEGGEELKTEPVNAESCRAAIENIYRIVGLNQGNMGADPEALIRSCQGNSTAENVECIGRAETEQHLLACEEEVRAKDAEAIAPRTPLERLTVRAPVTEGYNRKSWKHWTDEDHDCQDTRQEVLIAESEVPVGFKTKKTCKVAVGRWTCPYTGEVFTDPSKLDVGHMIPLEAAHAAGGHAWDAERRQAFANELGDKNHLIAVKASANRSKGKRGPEEWLPAKDDYVCEYVRTWIDIKVRWELAVSAEEMAMLTLSNGLCVPRGPSSNCEGSNDPVCGL